MKELPRTPSRAVGVPTRATVAVIGLGSVGGVAAGCLQEAGRHDVVGCSRRAIDRLTVERPEGTVEIPLRTLTDPSEAEPADWVILCTKAHDTVSTAAWLTRLCGPSTRVAVLQNGIGHIASVNRIVADATVVPAIVYYNGERLSVDRVRLRHVAAEDIVVPDDAAGQAFVRLFDGTSLGVSVSAEFTTLLWKKLLLNVVANPITALTRQRQAVLRRPDIHALSRAVLEEAIAVARADGATLAADEVEQTISKLLTFPPEAGTSMYFDCLAGRPLEVEALTGAIVTLGERHAIPTPVNSALLALLRAINDGVRTADYDR